MSPDIYQSITDRFIEQLKKGTVPWQQPWISSVQNIVSRKPYRGINAFTLGMTDRTSPFWLTFKQALDLGGHVKKGEQSQPVIYYKLVEKRDDADHVKLRDDGRPDRIPLVRWANVFNLDQTEGIEAPVLEVTQSPAQPLEKAAAIVQKAKLCPIHHIGFAALYSPTDDVIRLPAPTTFCNQESYFQTLYHEMTHASGHGSRLDREGITQPVRFGSEKYSKEELIAELGAAFLSSEAGILSQVQFENSAAYLASWIQTLENDPKMIVSAASHAQRSTDYILGIEQKESLQESPISAVEMPLAAAREKATVTQQPVWNQGPRPGERISRPYKKGMRL